MPRFRFRQHDDCCVGAIDIEIPGGPGRMTVAAVGDDRADALGRAALVAERIVSDPIMQALMPPQALVAIKAAKGLSAAAKRGSHVLRHFWGKLKGPGKKRLAAVLHKEATEREAEAGSNVSGWPYQSHVRDLLRPPHVGDVVGWNPFKRKRKKRKVPPMRRPRVAPPQEQDPDVQETEQQSYDDGGDNTESEE